MDLVVERVFCGACIVTIEMGLANLSGIRRARVNLTTRRVTVESGRGRADPRCRPEELDSLGYPAYPFSSSMVESLEAQEETRLLRCLGVAAFGAMT